MSKVVWMKVSYDDLSLPLIVADSMRELAKLCNVSMSCINNTRMLHKKGVLKREKYVRVVIDEE